MAPTSTVGNQHIGPPASSGCLGPGPADRTRPCAAVGAAVIALVTFLCWTGTCPWPPSVRDYPLDLRVYLLGGHAIASGHDLYGPAVHIGQYGFTYPPFAGWVFAMPSMLPIGVSFALLTATSVLSLVALVHLSDRELVRRIVDRRSIGALAVVAAMLCVEPVRTNLWDGQINLVLAAMVMLDLVGAGRRHRGVLVGLAAAVKLTPLLFVVYLLLRRRHADATRAGAAFIGAGGVSFAFLPGDSWRYWGSQLRHGSGLGNIASGRNHGLNGAALRLMPRHAGSVWLVLAVGTAAFGLGAAVLASRVGREPLAVGLVGLTACLVSPVSWSHHWVWFIPCLVGLGGWITRARTLTRWWSALAVGYLLGIDVVPAHWVRGNAGCRAVNTYAYLVLAVGLLILSGVSGRLDLAAGQGQPAPRVGRVRRAYSGRRH